MIRAVLCSAEHPEYGDVTVPLPIPKEEYDHAVELLASLEIGDARERDCYVREIRGGWPILHRLEKLEVNVDELDYLARRLDGFDFVPGAATPEDYGRYMIASSGHFEYDDNLAEYYDFGKYGRARIAQEQGEFNTRGYVSYRGTMRLQELMADVPPHDFGGLRME